MTTPARRYHLALRSLHEGANAVFATRDGWSVPLHYGDARAEHAALRGQAVVFDRSQRSRILVAGTDAADVLVATFAGHVGELEEGRAMRTVALDADGTIRDLVLVARTGGISYLVSGEPGQRDETLERLRDHVGADYDVRIEDRTESTCLLGLAGPAATAVVAAHLSEGLPARLQTLHCTTFEFHGFRSLATRTSDTGEDGYELMLAPAVAQHVVGTLVGAGVRLVGAAALETARVEACIPAFAPDLETGLSPAEADLDVMLDLPAGRERWMLSAILIEGPVMEAGTPVLAGGVRVGELRSCVASPTLGATVGLAVVEARVALPGVALDLDGTRATIVAKPLYRRRS